MVKYLISIIPDWLTLINSIEGQYLKSSKKKPLNQILEEINRHLLPIQP